MLMVLTILLVFFIPQTTLGQTDDMYEDLVDYMEDALEKYDIPGASLAIIEDGTVTFHDQWGELSDGSAVSGDSPFLIGSLSKPITSLAIMILGDDGQINLDESIQIYLPDFEYNVEGSNDITVRHLLEQTSGISQHDGLKVTDQERSPEGAIQEAVDELSGVTLMNEPGEVYEYNSANYLLLGAIIENVSNETYSEFVDTNIFEPLSMMNSAADYNTVVEHGFVAGYNSYFGHAVESDGFYDHAGAPYGYLTSSTEDLAKFLTFMLEGGEILSDESLELLKSPPGDDKTYGFGWHFSDSEGYPYHGGATADHRAQFVLMPEENKAAVLLTNQYHTLEDAQVTNIMNGVQSIMNGETPDELPSQGHLFQWIMLGVLILLVILTIVNFIFLWRKDSINKVITISVGIISILLAIGIIPLFAYVMGTPWQSISHFAPDIALLTYGLIGILAINGLLTLVIGVRRKK
ncbi:serine hydrolase domain-containing protein [Aliicoccus persicus]|nr:serine hydrolase domain-containing protein [Aliicoccus persicus]